MSDSVVPHEHKVLGELSKQVLIVPSLEETQGNPTCPSEWDSNAVWFQRLCALDFSIRQWNHNSFFLIDPILSRQNRSWFTKLPKLPQSFVPQQHLVQGPNSLLPWSSGVMQGPARSGPLGPRLYTGYYPPLMASSNLLPKSSFLLKHLMASSWKNPVSSIYSFILKTMHLGGRKRDCQSFVFSP